MHNCHNERFTVDACHCLSSQAKYFLMMLLIKEGGKKKYAKNQNAVCPNNFKLIQLSSIKPQHFEIC